MTNEHVKEITSQQAKEIGETLGVNWNAFSILQFKEGMMVELEHGTRDPLTDVTGDDLLMTGKIALAHLNEFPDYYIRLEIMEEEARAFWSNKELQPTYQFHCCE